MSPALAVWEWAASLLSAQLVTPARVWTAHNGIPGDS